MAANTFGVAVGYFIPAVFVSADDVDHPTRADRHIRSLFFSIAVASGTTAVLVLLFFQSRPPVAPSAEATAPKDPFCASMRTLLQKRSFVLLLAAFSLIVGLWMTVSTLIGEISASYDYNTT